MKSIFKSAFAMGLLLGALGQSSPSIAADAADSLPAGAADIQLPEGWTMEDVQKCMMAGTPGEEHAELAKDVGSWTGKCTMWMSPDSEPMTNDCTMEVTSILDGRFNRIEMIGEMPGMGPYHGIGFAGYDNLRKKYVTTWIDSMSTGIMQGEGELADGGKEFRWTYTAMCPMVMQEVKVREVDTRTGPNSKVLEMFGPDPKSGKEFKTMRIELTRK